MEWILNEIEAIFWVIIGIVILGSAMFLSDLFTGFIDRKVWKQKNRD